MLVDPYQDRYFKDGKVIGVNYSGPVGNQTRTETDLGLGLPVGGLTDRNKFGILTPPGSTEQGKMEILTPPGSTEKVNSVSLHHLVRREAPRLISLHTMVISKKH